MQGEHAMPLNYAELLSRRAENHPIRYSDSQILLYNLSVGMGRDPLDAKELPYVLEHAGLQAVPTFAATLGSGCDLLEEISQIAAVGGKGAVERPCGCRLLFLAGVGLNGDFQRGEIEVDPPVLEFFFSIDSPMGLPGDAKTGVVKDDSKHASGLKVLGRVIQRFFRI